MKNFDWKTVKGATIILKPEDFPKSKQESRERLTELFKEKLKAMFGVPLT